MFQNWFVVCCKMHQAFTISNFILINNRRLVLVKYSFVVDSKCFFQLSLAHMAHHHPYFLFCWTLAKWNWMAGFALKLLAIWLISEVNIVNNRGPEQISNTERRIRPVSTCWGLLKRIKVSQFNTVGLTKTPKLDNSNWWSTVSKAVLMPRGMPFFYQ